MRRTVALFALMLLSGCEATLRDRLRGVEPAAAVYAEPAAVPVVETYSRADIHAINANMQCKNMARTMVQIARCDAGR